MRRSLSSIFHALAGLLMAASGCNCDENLARLNASVKVTPDVLDFGKVPVGASKELPILIENIGSFRLELEDITSAAPFRGPTTFSSSIAVAGEITVMTAFFPVALGAIEGKLTITTDDPKVPVLDVPMLGEGIEAAVEVDPLVIDFGEIVLMSNTQPVSREVTVRNPGTDSFNLTAVDLVEGAGPFAVDPGSIVRTFTPSDSETFQVSFRPMAMGPAMGRVVIRTTVASQPEISVTMMGRAVGPLLEACAGGAGLPDLCTADGEVPRIDFAIDRNATATGYIEIMNVGDRDLTAQGTLVSMEPEITITPDPPGLGQVTLMPGTSRRFDVMYAPQDYAFDNQFLAFGSNAFNRPVQSIRIDARTTKPIIQVRPATLTFSQDGPVGETRGDIGILNCGELPLILGNVTFQQTMGTGTAFTMYTPPANGTQIQPAADCTTDLPPVTFEVGFDPPMSGFYEGIITIESNDPLEPMFAVDLIGSRR